MDNMLDVTGLHIKHLEHAGNALTLELIMKTNAQLIVARLPRDGRKTKQNIIHFSFWTLGCIHETDNSFVIFQVSCPSIMAKTSRELVGCV